MTHLIDDVSSIQALCYWGGGGAKNFSFFSLLNFFFKDVPGVLKRMQTKIYFSGGGGGGILGCLGRPTPPPGGRAGSENDTLLPMAMTCDRLKSYHPETLAAEEEKKEKKKKF